MLGFHVADPTCQAKECEPNSKGIRGLRRHNKLTFQTHTCASVCDCVCACVVCVHLGVSTRLRGRSYVCVWVSVCVCRCVWVCASMSTYVCVCVHMSTYVGVCECHVSGCTCKCVSMNVWVCVAVCEGGRGESVTVMGYSEWSESWVSCRGQFMALISANTSPWCWTEPSLGKQGWQPPGSLLPWPGAKPWHWSSVTSPAYQWRMVVSEGSEPLPCALHHLGEHTSSFPHPFLFLVPYSFKFHTHTHKHIYMCMCAYITLKT